MADGLQRPDEPGAIRDEEVARAFDRLDERVDLNAEQRVIVERLADRLTARVLWLLHDDGPN